ncbi:tetraacyldisaccharide 4'-kinase [Candidatus Cardinium hertigii]|uniref:Tetraacyldisaccharide 4'-kinase n=1 Tax=Candidatus Cardinium hertigii TaxID=247481 RepID=A0A3N2QC24_9BACT|nr:tetraacyldisaccharide 4'-kinase [Candidatus Cardinium hertigii]ROT47219.1 tetraacyldisaccharide 4'-kinase [Candidatus Cardinium hertigii]
MVLLLLQILRCCYGMVVTLRIFLYKKKIKSSVSYKNPKLISVGNLSLGGTGKTPLVIYLTKLLSNEKVVAVLSRGYKRTSTGFKVISVLESALTAGDEPYLLYKKFKYNPNVIITVCENRKEGITKIMEHRPDVEIILLDDAFQQLSITPILSILLTTFNEPFFKEHLLPLGRLREPRAGIARADIILVTKSPPCPTEAQITEIKEGIQKYQPNVREVPLFFTHIIYHDPIAMWHTKPCKLPCSIVLVTGIAYPLPLREYLETKGHSITHLAFPDHHGFNYNDIIKITRAFYAGKDPYKAIVTTEKDSVRFIDPCWEKLLSPFPMFYIPIEVGFTQEAQATFDAKIMDILHF